MSNERIKPQHPSHAAISVSRCTGRVNLFGSEIGLHDHFIAITIKKAQEHRDYGERHIFSREDIVEVYLSPVQWAELLTSMNAGDGVPCTLRFQAPNGVGRVEEPPRTQNELQVGLDYGENEIENLGTRADALRTRIKVLRAKASVSKKDLDEIAQEVDWLVSGVKRNLPFYLKQFKAAAVRTVTAAKADFDAWLMHAVTTAGVRALSRDAETGIRQSLDQAIEPVIELPPSE